MSSECIDSQRRRSGLGPKCGLTLSLRQQIPVMTESMLTSRRVSLNTYSQLSQHSTLTPDSPHLPQLASLECSQHTPHTHPSRETHSRPQCKQSSTGLDLNSLRLDTTSTRKTSRSETLQCNTNSNTSYCVNNYSNSCLSGGTPTAMLPILSYDNIVMSRPTLSSMDMTAMTGRVSRRSSKAQEALTCSSQSILSAMDRFVKAVNNMDSTVLVPSKLRDMDMASTAPTPNTRLVAIPPTLAKTDLHSFYLMLNDVKKELLWGTAAQHNPTPVPYSERSSPRDLKHIRQPSDDSLGSLGSTASSSSDQDTDSEADSLMTDRDSIDEHTSHLAAAFRHHLQGLHTILQQLADSADYLSSRYQEDIDASSL